MRTGFRCVLSLALAAGLPLSLVPGSRAAEFPSKPIEIVIGFSPGGPIDVATRILAEELSKELKTPLTVTYKPGAGGGVGVATVIQAKPDGYTLLSTFNSSVLNLPAMEKNPSFDPLKDLTPVAFCGSSPQVITAHTGTGLTSLDGLLKHVKERPGKLNLATSGVGTQSHFLLEYWRKRGIDITHVPTKGAAPTVTAILGKHVELAGSAYPPIAAHVKSGELRLLATTAKIKGEPAVPVLADVGFPETAALGIWLGVFAPANVPKPVLDRLAGAFERVLALPPVVEALERQGFTPGYRGPEAFRKQLAQEYPIMKEISRAANMVK